jgi:hypothetical protein
VHASHEVTVKIVRVVIAGEYRGGYRGGVWEAVGIVAGCR